MNRSTVTDGVGATPEVQLQNITAHEETSEPNRSTNNANPQFAKLEAPKFSNLRQDANPILAVHMIQEIYKMTIAWQEELKEIEQRILNVLATGPILAAWLESRTIKPSDTGEQIPTPYVEIDAIGLTTVDPQASYRLCGLDEYGELWTRPCLLPEILSVSNSIARYQQLKDLKERKQQVELYIRQILEDLVLLRMKLE
jgi:hypothetical protein